MPNNPPGPWVLDKVKKRLRAEQVERERIASARYRQEEDRMALARYRQEERHVQQRRDSQGQPSSCQCSVLLVLTLCSCLLSLAVIVLLSFVLRVSKNI